MNSKNIKKSLNGKMRDWLDSIEDENIKKAIKDNTIIFCGYSTPESTAGKIKNNTIKEVKIDGATIKNKANIVILNSFSSHADHDELLSYYSTINYNKICLVHSNQDDKILFGKELKERLSKENKTSKVIATNYEAKVNI